MHAGTALGRCQRNRRPFPDNGNADRDKPAPAPRKFAAPPQRSAAAPLLQSSLYLGQVLATRTASTSAQTVARAIQLLRLVASSHSRNLRLVDIAEMAQLEKSTAHRLLQRLEAERMLVRDPGMRGYRLGPLLYELGLAALPENNLRELSHTALQQLARATGDTAFLVVRSGFESVCVDRIAGNFAIQTMTQGVGDRHPLGVGAGGLAILAALSEADARIVVHAVAPQLRRYRLTEKHLRERLEAARARGMAIDEGNAALDVTALARVVRDRGGAPVAAVSVPSIKSRMTEGRQREVDKRLLACVGAIEAALPR